eukprot:gene1182-1359_t
MVSYLVALVSVFIIFGLTSTLQFDDDQNAGRQDDGVNVDFNFSVSSSLITALFIINFSLIVPVLLGVSGLFYFQSGFIFNNLTSVERYEKKSEYKNAKRSGQKDNYRWRYDRGVNNNFKDVFGDTISEWLCPTGKPKSDGINWNMAPPITPTPWRNVLCSISLLLLSNTSHSGVDAFELDDTIEVFYVEAPLMEAEYGNQLAIFNMFHAALLFKSTTTNETVIAEYDAAPSVASTIIPNIDNSTGTPQIVWYTEGITVIKGYNATYWSGRSFMMLITGDIYQKFICWVPAYNATHHLGGYLADVIARRDFMTLYVTEPPTLITNPEDPIVNAELVAFYSSWHFAKNETFEQILDQIKVISMGNFYFYYEHQYYNLSLAQNAVPMLGPLNFTYRYDPVPAGIPDPSSVIFSSDSCMPKKHYENQICTFGLLGCAGSISILVCFLIFGYIVVGVLYNVSNGRKGWDLVPTKFIWVGIGNGFRNLKSKLSKDKSNNRYKGVEYKSININDSEFD